MILECRLKAVRKGGFLVFRRQTKLLAPPEGASLRSIPPYQKKQNEQNRLRIFKGLFSAALLSVLDQKFPEIESGLMTAVTQGRLWFGRRGSSDGFESYRDWYYRDFWATHSRLDPMKKAAATIKRHWNGILRWFTSGINNGILEGLNSLVQSAKSKARGYRSTRNLIAMIYLVGGRLQFGLPTWNSEEPNKIVGTPKWSQIPTYSSPPDEVKKDRSAWKFSSGGFFVAFLSILYVIYISAWLLHINIIFLSCKSDKNY